jgi:hypothetical protein
MKPVRTYRWLETVPAGTTVVIGHHPISDEVVWVRENEVGGRIVHLDCGAGKGRGLAALRLAPDGGLEDVCRAVQGGAGIDCVATPMQPISAVAEDVEIG